jgi:V/A-type H+-transporting ATPase subunit I
MIARMAKIQVVGPRGMLPLTLQTLYAGGKVQIASASLARHPPGMAFRMEGASEDERAGKALLEEAVARIDRFLAMLGEFPGAWKQTTKRRPPAPGTFDPEAFAALARRVAVAEERVAATARRKGDLRDELTLIKRFEGIVRTFLPLVGRLGQTGRLEILGFTLKKKQAVVLDLLKEQLAIETGGEFEVILSDLDAATWAGILSFPKKHREVIQRIFQGTGISEIRLPARFGDRGLAEVLAELERRLEDIPGEIAEADAEVAGIVDDLDPWLLKGAREAAAGQLATMSVLPDVAMTERTFLLVGWVPEVELSGLLEELARTLPTEVTIFTVPITLEEIEQDTVPVRLSNPPLLRPFELCLRLVPIPRYGSIDPTPFVALFFPTFFGLILGDVGYGLILASVAAALLLLVRGKPVVRDVAVILLLCAVTTTAFGFLFGEFFGDLGIRLGWLHPILLDRERALIPTLFLAIGVGVAHVLLGVVLKLVGALRLHQRRHAGEAAGTLATVVALLLLLAAAVNVAPSGVFTAGVVLLIAGVPVLLLCGGVVGILEVFGIFGNMLSYARIMAIGLSSVILAVVANKIGGAFGNVAVGILLAVLLHLLNLVLGVFGPTIHSLRLHYVEFFGKFYIPGKKQYRPFRAERR